MSKYSGYGYHGGGRPRKAEAEKRQVVSLSMTSQEREYLRECASSEGLTVSEFVLQCVTFAQAEKELTKLLTSSKL